MIRTVLLTVFALATVLACAETPFEKVPDQAIEMLKKTARPKSVSTGLLFVNGRYLKPSYRVVRNGTALFVNGTQITGQIIPWTSFLATQDGYVPPKPVAAPVPKKTEKKAEDDDADLFDDAPAASKGESKAASEEPAASAESKFAFVANDRSDKLLKRIDEARKDVRTHLKNGYICFFGSRYTRVYVPARVARGLLDILPEAIRDANDGAELSAALRAKGFPFMGRELCDDLIANQTDYINLVKRREQIKDEEKLGLAR